MNDEYVKAVGATALGTYGAAEQFVRNCPDMVNWETIGKEFYNSIKKVADEFYPPEEK